MTTFITSMSRDLIEGFLSLRDKFGKVALKRLNAKNITLDCLVRKGCHWGIVTLNHERWSFTRTFVETSSRFGLSNIISWRVVKWLSYLTNCEKK